MKNVIRHLAKPVGVTAFNVIKKRLLTAAAEKAANYAADKAAQLMSGRTPARKRPRRSLEPGVKNFKRLGATSSKSSGFFKRGRRIRKRRVDNIAAKGVVVVKEQGGTASSQYCRYIGHATQPSLAVLKLICAAMVKTLLQKVGYEVVSGTATLDGLFVGDIIKLEHRESVTGVLTSTDYTLQGGDSIMTIATSLAGYLNFVNNQWQFTGILYVPYQATLGTSSIWRAVKLSLIGAKLMFDCKSTLKIQNRSINSTGEDADDVDNVPIYGRSYSGKGNGCATRDAWAVSTQNLYSYKDGIISWDGQTRDFREPPLPTAFDKPTKSGKAHLDPGEVKTSVLTEKFTVDLNRYLSRMGTVTSSGTAGYSKNAPGKFRLFALEKMIETNAGGDIVPLTLGYEHNMRIAVGFKQGWTRTEQIFLAQDEF